VAEVEPDADEEAKVRAGDGGVEVVEDFGCLQKECQLAMLLPLGLRLKTYSKEEV